MMRLEFFPNDDSHTTICACLLQYCDIIYNLNVTANCKAGFISF